jgi:geranylgeranyl diphosphate synthase, type II
VGCGLHVAGLGDETQRPYRVFAAELGLLFQIVDDILDAATDEWGYVRSHGLDGARRLAGETRAKTLQLLSGCDGATDDLGQIVAEVADRAA